MKTILAFIFAITLFFSASTLFAQDSTGCIDGNCAPQEQITPLTSDYCAAFTLEGIDFLLQIDESGHGHTLGAWCDDWNPTGTVNVIQLGSLKLVLFNLAGAGIGGGCADTIEINGVLIALNSGVTLGGRITWTFDGGTSGPFEYKGKAVCF